MSWTPSDPEYYGLDEPEYHVGDLVQFDEPAAVTRTGPEVFFGPNDLEYVAENTCAILLERYDEFTWRMLHKDGVIFAIETSFTRLV